MSITQDYAQSLHFARNNGGPS